MNVVIEEVSSVEKKISVTIPAERVKRELERAYRNLQGQVNMRGFRRGHVPRNLLEARFKTQVEGEVTSKLVSDTLESTIEENKIFVVSRPVVTPGPVGKGDFTYTATVETKPVVVATGYRGIEMKRPVFELDDAAIDRKLEQARRNAGTLEPLEEERALAKGDVAIVNYTLRIEGEVVEGPVESLQIEVADTDMLPGFADAIVGMNKGETRTFEIAGPEKAPKPELVGKNLQFEVTLNEVKRFTMPVMDDDFAKDQGHESLASWRQKESDELRAHLDESARDRMRDAAVDKLLEMYTIELPKGLVSQQVDGMVNERKKALRRQGMKDQADLLAEAGREEMVGEARRQLAASLILESIVEKENIEATADDINNRLAEVAKSSGQRIEAVKGYYIKNNLMDDLKIRIAHEKALDLVVSTASTTDEILPFSEHATDHQH